MSTLENNILNLEHNPFLVPDLTPMYEAVKDYVRKHQEEKGFICTDNSDCDTIWTFVYDYDDFEAREYEVKAVRVKDDDLQILYDLSNVKYDDEYIVSVDDLHWFSVLYDDCVYYIPTIFNIAESIREYAE